MLLFSWWITTGNVTALTLPSFYRFKYKFVHFWKRKRRLLQLLLFSFSVFNIENIAYVILLHTHKISSAITGRVLACNYLWFYTAGALSLDKFKTCNKNLISITLQTMPNTPWPTRNNIIRTKETQTSIYCVFIYIVKNERFYLEINSLFYLFKVTDRCCICNDTG